MKSKWGKIVFGVLDTVLIVYLVLAMTSFNKPLLGGSDEKCEKITILIDENVTDGFLDSQDIKSILQQNNLYALGQPLDNINTRRIEEVLLSNEFIDSVLCYKSCDGNIYISLKQRTAIFHIKSDKGENYYLDSNGRIISKTQIPVNVIVATGHISRGFAKKTLTKLGNILTRDPYWNAEIEQINVLESGGIEIVPKSANYIVYLGKMEKEEDMDGKLEDLCKFYTYGLEKIGWNKYSYINMEFPNQIICKKAKIERDIEECQ